MAISITYCIPRTLTVLQWPRNQYGSTVVLPADDLVDYYNMNFFSASQHQHVPAWLVAVFV